MTNPRTYAKAIASAVVAAAAYLVGVLPAEGGISDVSTVQWLGLVVFLGGAFGVTYGVSNRDPHGEHQDESVRPPELDLDDEAV
jgi:hypothetical protein